MIPVGRLGSLRACPGFYVYAGSAFGPGGVGARCARHLRLVKPLHWHIDYLRSRSRILEIWFTYDAIRREHLWASILGRSPGAGVPLRGFGASDCTCPTHLFHFAARPSFLGFRRRVRRICRAHGTISRTRGEVNAGEREAVAGLRKLNAPLPRYG